MMEDKTMKTLIYDSDSPIVSYLTQKDPLLITLFEKKKRIHVTLNENYFIALVETIIAQQLSAKVASVISKRVHDYFSSEITPEKIIDTHEDELRAIGLSFQKIKYLKSLATHIIEKDVDLDTFNTLSDQAVIDMLIKIKGIGVWTAQMFLMFSLGREDVFSSLDLGLRNALKKIYQNPNLTMSDIDDIALSWSPYRSVVAHFLWHAWDNNE